VAEDPQDDDEPFVVRLGPVHVDVPRSLGYFGGIGLAVAFELIAPELALFVALIPIVKLFKRKNATKIEKALAAVVEGAAKPLGGDAESTVRSVPRLEIWEDGPEPATQH
jgi:hypothetical protein